MTRMWKEIKLYVSCWPLGKMMESFHKKKLEKVYKRTTAQIVSWIYFNEIMLMQIMGDLKNTMRLQIFVSFCHKYPLLDICQQRWFYFSHFCYILWEFHTIIFDDILNFSQIPSIYTPSPPYTPSCSSIYLLISTIIFERFILEYHICITSVPLYFCAICQITRSLL